MERFVWVCLGGAAGTGARYLLASWITERSGGGFPWGTLCVNLIGSFLLGGVVQVASRANALSPAVQVTLTVGVLGGFTTYSTFNQDTLAGMQRGAWGLASLNLLATILGCLAAGWLGQAAARTLLA